METHYRRQEPADLDFRVDPGFQAAEEFHDAIPPHENRGIGLLGIDRAHVFDFCWSGDIANGVEFKPLAGCRVEHRRFP